MCELLPQVHEEHASGVRQVEDSEIIALASVDYESASRLEFDRRSPPPPVPSPPPEGGIVQSG